MIKQKFQRGDKVKIDCLTEQLSLIQASKLLPGDEVFIVRIHFRDKDKTFYKVSKKKGYGLTYIIPENYLTKITD